MAETNLTVLSNGAGNAEALQTDTDSSSGVSSLGATLLDCDSSANGVCPLSVLEADGLSFFNDLIGVDTLSIADLLALVNGGNAILIQNSKDFRLASFLTFKLCHYCFPP